jgi:hypothetical protein
MMSNPNAHATQVPNRGGKRYSVLLYTAFELSVKALLPACHESQDTRLPRAKDDLRTASARG